MKNIKPASASLAAYFDQEILCTIEEEKLQVPKIPYASTVGSLMYAIV